MTILSKLPPATAPLSSSERAELHALRNLVIDADGVARQRGDKYGLCDQTDNRGRPYPSQWAANLIGRALSARLG